MPPQVSPNVQHLPRAPHQAAQGAISKAGSSKAGSHQSARTRSCSPSRAPSPLSRQSSRSRSQSVASTTNAVDFEWDYYEYRHGDDKEGQLDQHPGPSRAGGSLERHGRKDQIPRRLPHADATQHSHQQPDNDDEEEEIQFFDANISLSPHQGAHSGSKPIMRMPNTDALGLPLEDRTEEGQLPRLPAPGLVASHQGGAVGPGPSHSDQPLLGQLGTPTGPAALQHKTLKFPPYYYGDDSPRMADLGLPRLPVGPHGHQVFDNCELQEPPALTKKKKRPSLLSSHVQDTRPLSSRKTAKAAAEKITASSKKSTRKSTTKTAK